MKSGKAESFSHLFSVTFSLTSPIDKEIILVLFPDSSVGKESACNEGDLGLIPELGRSPGRRERLHTPVFWPGEFYGLYRRGHKGSDMTERL